MKSNQKILTFRKTHTLLETGKKFNLTAERVRQIEQLKDRQRCDKHKRYFYNRCSFCLNEFYKDYLDKLSYGQILKEVEKEAKNKKRDWVSTQRRVYLIEFLRIKYEKSFAEIAKLLKRDQSTIIYLYSEYIEPIYAN